MPDEDTLQAADASDATTTAGSDGAGTLVAEAGDDTVQAAVADDKSPFAQFDEGQQAEAAGETGQAPEARRDTVQASAGDDDLTAMEREAQELDESLGTAGKLTGIVKRLTARDRQRDAEAKQLRKQVSAAADSAAWSRFEEECGHAAAPAEVRTKLTRKEMDTRFQKHYRTALQDGASPDEARGEARATLKFEVKEIIKRASVARPKRGKVVTDDNGSRLSPPGGVTSRPVKEKLVGADAYDKGDWSYPSVGDFADSPTK